MMVGTSSAETLSFKRCLTAPLVVIGSTGYLRVVFFMLEKSQLTAKVQLHVFFKKGLAFNRLGLRNVYNYETYD